MYEEEPQKPKFIPSAPFRDMADRIDRNEPEEFAGAFMIVLRDGTKISGLIVDPDDNPAMLLSNVATKIELAIRQIEDGEKAVQQRGYR